MISDRDKVKVENNYQAAIAAKAEAEAAEKLKKDHGGRTLSSILEGESSGHPAQDRIRTLQRPGGIQQAILLREILERPTHRW